MTQEAWAPNWESQIQQKIRSLGYANMTEVLADMPAQPYQEVMRRLGGVPPIQIISIQFREAKQSGKVKDAAMDSLARNLVEKLPQGWGVGSNSEWQGALALSSWTSGIQVTGGLDELKSTLLAIAKSIRELPPPSGWIPRDLSDPIIERAFSSHWR